MQVDKLLVARISKRVNGANIHEFNNILQSYYSYIELHEDEPNRGWDKQAQKMEIRLRCFGAKLAA